MYVHKLKLSRRNHTHFFQVQAPVVVNCAGPWFGELNDSVTGAHANKLTSTSMLPTRIQVGHKHVEGPFLDLPFVADSWGNSGVYFMPRRQNSQLVFGSIAHRFESEVTSERKQPFFYLTHPSATLHLNLFLVPSEMLRPLSISFVPDC